MKKIILGCIIALLTANSYAFKTISQEFKHSPNTSAGIIRTTTVSNLKNPSQKRTFMSIYQESEIANK